jgi:hypothetical protein
MAYLISLVTLAIFLIVLRLQNWPLGNGSFNVWVNLPTFDPTAGGDVVERLERDARFNIALGFLLPFLMPAAVKAAGAAFGAVSLENPQTLIWTVAAWAFLPTSLFMRGIAMSRVASMIDEKRRKARAAARTWTCSWSDPRRWRRRPARGRPSPLRDLERGPVARRAGASAARHPEGASQMSSPWPRSSRQVAPDVILLTGFDYDLDGHALAAFAARIEAAGADYPHRFAYAPNAGMATGLDLDGDGRRGGPRDAQGYGEFAGQGGMALLSRLPVDAGASRDFSAIPLARPAGRDPARRDPAGAPDSGCRPSPLGRRAELPDGRRAMRLWAWHATPPVFDGPEDRNGRRNHDEAAFWLRYLEGALPVAPDRAPFVLLGDANLDPVDGDGRPEALWRCWVIRGDRPQAAERGRRGRGGAGRRGERGASGRPGARHRGLAGRPGAARATCGSIMCCRRRTGGFSIRASGGRRRAEVERRGCRLASPAGLGGRRPALNAAVVEADDMLGLGEEEPAGDEGSREVREDREGGERVGERQEQEDRREERGEDERDRAQLARVLAADDVDHLAQEVVRAGVRRLEGADRAAGEAGGGRERGGGAGEAGVAIAPDEDLGRPSERRRTVAERDLAGEERAGCAA